MAKKRDYEENRKLQTEVIRNLQILLDHSKKEKENMAEEIKEKDHIIYMLKQKGDNTCSNGCGRYTKSMDEVVKATAKHREAAITLKEICEKQKVKRKEYGDEIDKYEMDLNEHEEKIKQLEEDLEIGYDMNDRKRKEIDKLNTEVKDQKKKVIEMGAMKKGKDKKKEITDKIIESLQKDKEDLKNEPEEGKLMEQFEENVFKKDKAMKEEEIKTLLKEMSEINEKDVEKETLIKTNLRK